MGIAPKLGSLGNLLFRLWFCLEPNWRYKFLMLFFLMALSALAELISLGAVLPFLGILVTPEKFYAQPYVTIIAQPLNIQSPDQLLAPFTCVFIFAALTAGAIRILFLWTSTRFAHGMGAILSIEVYKRTLYQPYSVHVARNSSEVIGGIQGKVGGVVAVLQSSLLLISSIILLLTITLALLAIDPVVSSVAIIGFGAVYGLITWLSRRRLNRMSLIIAREQTQSIKLLQEGLGGIRDVLLDGTQGLYCDIYRKSDQPLRYAQGQISFIGQSPRFAMEALGISLIALIAYVFSRQVGGIAAGLPVLGALAIGAQRLLPAMQQMYVSWVGIVGNHASLRDAIDLLEQPLAMEVSLPRPNALNFERKISFEEVCFRYSKDGAWVLNECNLTIVKGARVGFVGSTGSGKSTTLDLLMGLLSPNSGRILVDEEPITGNRLIAWQRTIAHVPQNIFLADSSIAENIAFGVPENAINMERIKQAARRAQISEFIESQNGGYNAVVGERGIRLSGGQRQRIGIARALYKHATVLVFDEATSALDNSTEQSVMDAIEGLGRDMTILLIAHRLTTVRRCDTIIEIANGRVAAQGTYEELLKLSSSFSEAAKAAT